MSEWAVDHASSHSATRSAPAGLKSPGTGDMQQQRKPKERMNAGTVRAAKSRETGAEKLFAKGATLSGYQGQCRATEKPGRLTALELAGAGMQKEHKWKNKEGTPSYIKEQAERACRIAQSRHRRDKRRENRRKKYE